MTMRTLWAVGISLALHAVAFQWGGDLLTRESSAPTPLVSQQMRLSLTPPALPSISPAVPPAASPVVPQRPSHKLARVIDVPKSEPMTDGTPSSAVVAALPSGGAPRTAPTRQHLPQPAGSAEAVDHDPQPASAPHSVLSEHQLPQFPIPQAMVSQPLVAPANPLPDEPLVTELPRRHLSEAAVGDSELRPDFAVLVSAVRGRINKAKHYPRLARRAGHEGRVLLKFRIAPSGEVTLLRVLESSNYATLDRAARRAVERAAPFPHEAAHITGNGIEVILPVIFQLR